MKNFKYIFLLFFLYLESNKNCIWLSIALLIWYFFCKISEIWIANNGHQLRIAIFLRNRSCHRGGSNNFAKWRAD